jgi:hypothetical protein
MFYLSARRHYQLILPRNKTDKTNSRALQHIVFSSGRIFGLRNAKATYIARLGFLQYHHHRCSFFVGFAKWKVISFTSLYPREINKHEEITMSKPMPVDEAETPHVQMGLRQ